MREPDVVTTPDGIAALKEPWDRLLAESGSRAVYLTPEWFLSWWTGFGAGHQMHIVVVRDRTGRLAGIAPLMIASQRYHHFSLKSLCFIANGHSPSADFIIRQGSGEEVVRALAGYAASFRGWDVARFQKMCSRSDNYRMLVGTLPAAGRRFRVYDSINTPYIRIEAGWEEYLAGRSPKFRKVLRNIVNRSSRAGKVEVEHLPVLGEDKEVLETMAAVSSRSWKRAQGTDLSSSGNNMEFYRRLMATMGPRGWLSIWVLRVGGAAVAFEFHVRHRGTVYPLWADYDTSYSQFSPGRLLEFNILKTLFEERNVTEYNSCGNAYQYLLNWTSTTCQMKSAECYSGAPVSRLAYWGHRFGPVLRRVVADTRPWQ